MTNLAAAAAAKSLQSCPTLCDPIDGSLPGSLVPGILQACPESMHLEHLSISKPGPGTFCRYRWRRAVCGHLRAGFAWIWLDEFAVSLLSALYTVMETTETETSLP